jgi:hypothetical protein
MLGYLYYMRVKYEDSIDFEKQSEIAKNIYEVIGKK